MGSMCRFLRGQSTGRLVRVVAALLLGFVSASDLTATARRRRRMQIVLRA